MAHESKPLNIAEVTAEDLKQHMQRGNGLTVINVLESKFYDDCRIKGSINVPYNQLKERAQKWDTNKRIVVYCAHYQCSASRQAFKLLDEMGFVNVAAYEGGMREWFQKGFECEGACHMDYLKG